MPGNAVVFACLGILKANTFEFCETLWLIRSPYKGGQILDIAVDKEASLRTGV